MADDTVDAALAAFHILCREEGIIPALESSHAVAAAIERAPRLSRDAVVVVCLSGRGDKDMATVAAYEARQAAALGSG